MILRALLFALVATVAHGQARIQVEPLEGPDSPMMGAAASVAQETRGGGITVKPLEGGSVPAAIWLDRPPSAETAPITTITALPRVRSGEGAVLRGLDMLSSRVVDIRVKAGESVSFDALQITLDECRYPRANPGGDAYAHLRIHGTGPAQGQGQGAALFAGWMVASSPALNALEHPRYDVWLLRCTMAEAGSPTDSAESAGAEP